MEHQVIHPASKQRPAYREAVTEPRLNSDSSQVHCEGVEVLLHLGRHRHLRGFRHQVVFVENRGGR